MPGNSVAACALAAALALLGCGSGCDGERARSPEKPRLATLIEGAVAATSPELDGGVTAPPTGSPAAPPGSLDGLYASLAAAERAEPAGRALMLFFGDSHTAGDSMTSRLRVTMQSRFGDAGRGLGSGGRPPSRPY